MNFDRDARLVGAALLFVVLLAVGLAIWSNWMWPPASVGAQ